MVWSYINGQAIIKYLITLPIPMLKSVMKTFALIRPSNIDIALPKSGRKAKNPIHAPRPPMNRWALSRLSFFTWRYFSIQSILPIRPTL